MKRMTLIAVALCLMMITTVGAGVVAAKQPVSDKVKQFDVVLYQGTETSIGTLSVNMNAWSYALNVRGLSPDTEYWLKCMEAPGVLATVTSTAGGAVHMQGKLDAVPSDLVAPGAKYVLGTGTPPPESSPYLVVDAKYGLGVTQWEVFGTAVFITFDSAGHATQTPAKNAWIQVCYQLGDNPESVWGAVSTDDNGKFHIWDKKLWLVRPSDFYVRCYYTYNGVDYVAVDNNVQLSW